MIRAYKKRRLWEFCRYEVEGGLSGGWTEPCSWLMQSKMPCPVELGKKGRKNLWSLLWGSEQVLSHSLLFFEQGDLMYWQTWSFPSIVFCKGHTGGSLTPERRRTASSFSLGYRESMETLFMHFLKADTVHVLGLWGRFIAHKCSIGKSQGKGQCKGCLQVEDQKK